MGNQLHPLQVSELYARALALEREAASRYSEFTRYLRDLGFDRLADRFEGLEEEKRECVRLLQRATAAIELPNLSPWEYSWYFTSSPDALELAFPLLPQCPRDALNLALAAGRRAAAFYTAAAFGSPEEEVRRLAAAMAAEARRHVEALRALLEREPDPRLDFDLHAARGARHDRVYRGE